MPQAAQLPRTGDLKNRSLRSKFCPRQRSCLRQVTSSTKSLFSAKSAAPGSAAAPDKWLGREKATNRCSQGRGASFRGVRGAERPGNAGGLGGAAPRRQGDTGVRSPPAPLSRSMVGQAGHVTPPERPLPLPPRETIKKPSHNISSPTD